MKNLILILMTAGLAACSSGGSGGSSGGSVHVPDTSEHDYGAVAAALVNTNQVHAVDLHQICDFGYSDIRDESVSFMFQDPNIQGGVGCGTAQNYILELTNNSPDDVYLVITIDGVNQPQETIAAGQTYTFTRGY